MLSVKTEHRMDAADNIRTPTLAQMNVLSAQIEYLNIHSDSKPDSMPFFKNVFSRNRGYTPVSSSPTSMEEPFLPTEDPFATKERETTTSRVTKRARTSHLLPWTISAMLFVALLWTNRSPSLTFDAPSYSVYSPAEHLIEPKNIVFSGGFIEPSIYQGPSDPERDQAWEDLYSFGISRIPKSSAAKLVNKTIPIPGDTDHYIVGLDVFHQLHCINMIRLRIFSPTTPNTNDPLEGTDHLSHCIDWLRQSIMCSVDITPIPWRWDSEAKLAKPTAEIQHTCRNFEKVREWAKENHLEKFDKTVYVEDELKSNP